MSLQNRNMADLAYLNSLIEEQNTGVLRSEHIEKLKETFALVDLDTGHHISRTEVRDYIELVEDFKIGFFKIDHDQQMLEKLKAMDSRMFSNHQL